MLIHRIVVDLPSLAHSPQHSMISRFKSFICVYIQKNCMTQPDPLNGTTPYEILGVKETDSLLEVEQKANQLLEKYGPKDADPKALEEIDDAWKWIQEHHKQIDEDDRRADSG